MKYLIALIASVLVAGYVVDWMGWFDTSLAIGDLMGWCMIILLTLIFWLSFILITRRADAA